MLNIALGHDGGLARTSTCIQSDVAVEVQSQPLAGVELNHQFPPPKPTAAPQELEIEQYWQCVPGVGLMWPAAAVFTAR